MKIAIINENSQAPKNGIIEAALKKVVEPMGHEVVTYGMYSDASPRLTYVPPTSSSPAAAPARVPCWP